jgi:hypothetical protein
MHGEDLLIDYGSDRQAVKTIGKSFPQLDIVPAFAFVVESIDSVDGSAFMIASQNEKVLGVLNLVGEEKTDSLERLLATIDVIA